MILTAKILMIIKNITISYISHWKELREESSNIMKEIILKRDP
jgi:hypothetical protein